MDELTLMTMRNYVRAYSEWIKRGVDINNYYPTSDEAAQYASICNILRTLGFDIEKIASEPYEPARSDHTYSYFAKDGKRVSKKLDGISWEELEP